MNYFCVFFVISIMEECRESEAAPISGTLSAVTGYVEPRILGERGSLRRAGPVRQRLYFSAFAGVLLLTIRRLGLAGTEFARAQCDTIRCRFLKVAAVVKVTARKGWVPFSSVYPWQESFARILARLGAASRASPR